MSTAVENVWYWAPFQDSDRSAEGWIFGITALTCVFLVTSLRLFLRRGVHGLDDAFICGSLASYMIQHALLFYALRVGLGKDNELLRAEQQHSVATAFLASDILALVSHYLAKLSIAWFIRRSFFNHALINAWSCHALIGAIVGSGVVSLILAGVARFPLGALKGITAVPVTFHSWTAITALDVINEIVLAAVPTWLVLTIMKKGSQKTLVSIVFLSRLPLCAMSILHLTRINFALSDEAEIIIRLLGCSGTFEVLLVWSLISASIPALKSLVQPFNDIKDVVEEKDAGRGGPQGAFFYRGG
ncbi:hypothetical protein KVT40_003245 [Elsinoe batatas]|uniref:Rhodopsin domain-containing protein n=1 Tax=Elsinoe batatas TaxID=2601811 RepID=A0A8K0L8E6_9PEZI|nr:hypothetical protein KVT40_003245 [Elsinoe batatas]